MTNHFNIQGMEGETVSLSQRELDIDASVRGAFALYYTDTDCPPRYAMASALSERWVLAAEQQSVRAAFAAIQAARARVAHQPRDWHGRFVPSSKTARVHDALKRAVRG